MNGDVDLPCNRDGRNQGAILQLPAGIEATGMKLKAVMCNIEIQVPGDKPAKNLVLTHAQLRLLGQDLDGAC